MSPALRARLRRVRLLAMDVDGVLTDGRMILSARGDELKAFHSRDGLALQLARGAGLHTAWVTGETGPIARVRGRRLGVEAIVLGARRKGDVLSDLCRRFGVPLAAAAFVGDDLLDLPALQIAGLAVAVADASPVVRAAAHLVTAAPGGAGAVRECVEVILRAQGVWEPVLDAFLREHGGRALGSPARGRRARGTMGPVHTHSARQAGRAVVRRRVRPPG